MIYGALWAPPLKSLLVRLPFVRRIYDGWRRVHPFDAAYGIETSGSVTAGDCAPNAVMAAQISPYGGSQPTIVRRSLAWLPDHGQYAFVDLGCGKGRPLVVASEFPFRRLLGIEIAPELAGVARANAAVIAAAFPDRTAIEIQIGDATAVSLPGELAVYFMYHPFHRSLVISLVANLESQLEAGLQHAFLVYYNPVHGELLDSSPRFSRWCAATLPYAPAEIGYGPDLEDTFVIWQTVPERYPPWPRAARAIIVDGSSGGVRLDA